MFFGDTRKKPLPNPRSRFTSVFSSKRFIVSALAFVSLIHFELIFVNGVRYESTFILLHVNSQLSNRSFPQLTGLSILVENQVTINVRVCF